MSYNERVMKGVAQQALTEEERRILSRALWDLDMTPEEFLAIIKGTSKRKRPGRGFCVARLLETVNWLEAVRIVDAETLLAAWQDARPHVRFESIREGMDFACKLLR